MNPATLSRSLASSAPARARRRWWLIGLAAGLLLAALVAVWAMLALGGSMGVPAGLDYATTRLSAAGLFRASYTVSAPAIPINQLHTWTLHVESADGQPIDDAQIAVDGDMPQHGHGLPTRPQVTRNLGGGDYLVEGMKFQMGGWWVMDFDITVAGQTDRVSFNLMLK
jgi:hypothetical protein